MKVLVIGATGQTGQLVVKQGLALGYDMVAYVRHPERMQAEPGLTIISGELTNTLKLQQSMQGVNAIVVTLGASIKKISEPVLQENMPYIIAAAQSKNVDRMIILSALGVGQTKHNTVFPYNLMTKILLGKPFDDHEKSERLLTASDLQWTTVNPGILTNHVRPNRARQFLATSGKKAPLIPMTQRQDVADTILMAVTVDETIHQAVIVLSN